MSALSDLSAAGGSGHDLRRQLWLLIPGPSECSLVSKGPDRPGIPSPLRSGGGKCLLCGIAGPVCVIPHWAMISQF